MKGTPSVIKQIHYNCLIGVKKQDYVDPSRDKEH